MGHGLHRVGSCIEGVMRVVRCFLATALSACCARSTNLSRGVAGTPRLNKAARAGQCTAHIAGHGLPDHPALPSGSGKPCARLEHAVHFFQEERVLPHSVQADARFKDRVGFAVPVKPCGLQSLAQLRCTSAMLCPLRRRNSAASILLGSAGRKVSLIAFLIAPLWASVSGTPAA